MLLPVGACLAGSSSIFRYLNICSFMCLIQKVCRNKRILAQIVSVDPPHVKSHIIAYLKMRKLHVNEPLTLFEAMGICARISLQA